MDSEDAQDALVTLKRIYERLLNEPSQPFDCKEEVPSEQQEWSPSLVQGEPKPPHIKEEENELWSSREEEQLQGPEVLPVTPVPVRSKNGDVKAQSSHLHQSQTGNNRETSPSTDQMKTEPDGEDCGLSEPASNLDPAANLQPNSDGEPLSSDGCESSETEDSDDGWNQAEDAQSGLDGIKNEISPQRCTEMKPFSCFVCGKGFSRRDYAQKHMRIHDRKKPFTCSVCGKGFSQRGWMRRHMKIHPGEKPFDCSVCGKCFTRRDAAETHARVHTGEKPFGCPFCCKRFSNRWGMTKHARVHTGQKPFSCSVCEKGFSSGKQMERHMRTHTAEKPFSCSVW
ncbi:oocyte zinc finger protein XlCOF7.1-like [Lampris incognitus]|uniref:oocyte zinc finger protein XlCOF7.1-like n=1 Tax=Lampris incognitus TaxID=2546036 RepID=UPI0024B5F5FF|nr:oocyte zinc finger protein XlCOF7.1-like [Lampris incognitus]